MTNQTNHEGKMSEEERKLGTFQRAINGDGKPCYHKVVKCFYCKKEIKCDCKEEKKQ